MSRHRIIAPVEIERKIDQGEPIVIYEGHALHLGEWINRHPGGRLAILHMVGRDATDEINIYHSNKALLMMTKHRIGRVQLPWANLEPPIRHPDYYKNLDERKRLERLGAAPATDKSRRGRSVDLGS
ncbi:delta 8- E -sphingolipid desaturase, partial [Pyrenophora tritici-repentis]